MVLRYILALGCALCLLACTPEKKVEDPLPPVVVEAAPVTVDVTLSPPPFPVLSLQPSDYPKAIIAQSDAISETPEPVLKRDAYLRLFSLYIDRMNPEQDFFAAADALNRAIELDPALLDQPLVQQWFDVLAELRVMKGSCGDARQLYEENEVLREKVQKQQCAINYLEFTLDELRKVESDVAKKKRLYR